MNIRESFERVGFTPEEKMDLTARLEWAAGQEELMTNATKKTIKRISGGMIFGIAAAAVMTVGTLAAVINPGLRSWFDTTTTGAPEALEKSIYRLDRSQTYNGWTVTLDECVGDDSSVYIWVDVTAPEGTVLAPKDGGGFQAPWSAVEIGRAGSRFSTKYIPDPDLTDNQFSFVLEGHYERLNPRGQRATVTVSPIVDYWTDEIVTSESENYGWHEDSGITAAIRDHKWVFEDVKLDYPDQTIRLEPNVTVPYLDGTATVTSIEISPLSMYMRLEGGSCSVYADHMDERLTFPEEQPAPSGDNASIVIGGGGDVTITTPDGTSTPLDEMQEDPMSQWLIEEIRLDNALTFSLTLRDGTEPKMSPTSGSPGHMEGIEGADTPYVYKTLMYAAAANRPVYILDPAQVDHVTVCGVDIPVNPAEENK